MTRWFLISVFCLCIVGCSKKITKPSFIQFKVENDSLFVISKNSLPCPIYIKTSIKNSDSFRLSQLEAKSQKIIYSFPEESMDSTTFLKKHSFNGYYGIYDFKRYDTTYNYALPFTNGYKSYIIQGYDGSFSHKGLFSAKTIDFDMAIGDTITASRDGVVIAKLIKHNKQGTTEEFRPYGNYILVYHKDNTFSQYVHLKQYGNLVDVGDSVKINQPIALSGFTGWTTVPHLHFGVYKPTENGLVSIPVILDSIPAKTLKKGAIIIKK